MFPSDQMSLPPFGNQPQHHYVGSDPDVQRNTTISLNENMVAKLTSSETDATVFVGDLAVLCQEEHLAALFSQYGPLKDVRIIRENKSNQPLYYGFVEFFDRAVAQQAMTQLNGYLFMGRNIRVKWATSPASPRIPTNDGRRSGGPDGDHINSQTQPQHDTSTKWSQLPKSLPNVQVLFSFISNQSQVIVTEEFIRKHFSKYGVLMDVCIKKININKETQPQTQNGYGFVHYQCSLEGVQAALQAVAGFHRKTIEDVKFDCKISHQFQQFLDNEENMKAIFGSGVRQNNKNGGVSSVHSEMKDRRMNRQHPAVPAPVVNQSHHQIQYFQNVHLREDYIVPVHQSMDYHAPAHSSNGVYYSVYPSPPLLVTPNAAAVHAPPPMTVFTTPNEHNAALMSQQIHSQHRGPAAYQTQVPEQQYQHQQPQSYQHPAQYPPNQMPPHPPSFVGVSVPYYNDGAASSTMSVSAPPAVYSQASPGVYVPIAPQPGPIVQYVPISEMSTSTPPPLNPHQQQSYSAPSHYSTPANSPFIFTGSPPMFTSYSQQSPNQPQQMQTHQQMPHSYTYPHLSNTNNKW